MKIAESRFQLYFLTPQEATRQAGYFIEMKRQSTKKAQKDPNQGAKRSVTPGKKPAPVKAKSVKAKEPRGKPAVTPPRAADSAAEPKKSRASSPRPRPPKAELERPPAVVVAAPVPPKAPATLAPELSKPPKQKAKPAKVFPPIGKPAPVTQPTLQPSEPATAATPPTSPRIAGLNLPVPAILLEGDEPVSPHRAGPGEKFAVGASTSVLVASEAHRLPAAYGTGRLTAIARDPWSVFAHWDFTGEQQHYYNSLSADRHLVLRARFDSACGPVAGEVHLHAETRHWFLHVPRAGAQYVVELGYYQSDGQWTAIRTSTPVTTQADRASEDQAVYFASAAPASPSIEFSLPDRAAAPGLHESIKTPVLPGSHASRWTAAREAALAELISTTIKKEQIPGSLEILELLRRQLKGQIIPSEAELALPGLSSAALGISSVRQEEEQLPSSPLGGERVPPRRDFWFNVNAELIIYGATEPDARVTIGGRPIRLRPDGTFSYRFALPDGYYELPAAAATADKTEVRRADLRFSRQTVYSGEVGAHPQDPALRTPAAENVA